MIMQVTYFIAFHFGKSFVFLLFFFFFFFITNAQSENKIEHVLGEMLSKTKSVILYIILRKAGL